MNDSNPAGDVLPHRTPCRALYALALLGASLAVPGCFAEPENVGVDAGDTDTDTDGSDGQDGGDDAPADTAGSTSGAGGSGSGDDTTGDGDPDDGGDTSSDDGDDDDESTGTIVDPEPMVWLDLFEVMCTEAMVRNAETSVAGHTTLPCDQQTANYPIIGTSKSFQTTAGPAERVVTVAMPSIVGWGEAYLETQALVMFDQATDPELQFAIDCAAGETGAFAWAVWQSDGQLLEEVKGATHTCGDPPTFVTQPFPVDDAFSFGIRLVTSAPSMPIVALVDPVVREAAP